MTAPRSMRPWLAWPLVLMLVACQATSDDSVDVAIPVAVDEPEAAGAPGVPASPWVAAAARGVAFRGIGNEPGWVVEVDRGATPALRATLDYGNRMIVVPRAVVLEGGAGYHGTAADGAAVILRIRRQSCSDGMSDQTYGMSAELSIGDSTYHGCGRSLAD